MLSPCVLAEFRSDWLPHMTDHGLQRIVELLEKSSPMLIHGAFTRAMPQGCLASHIAWNHPQTECYDHEAGVRWLTRVARLNPATSHVIHAWDVNGFHDYELRCSLLAECRDELERRQTSSSLPAEAPMCEEFELAVCG